MHFHHVALAIACALPLSLQAADAPVFLDATKSWNERVTDYVGRLTLEQKADLLDHRGPTVTVAGFALRSDQWNQCLNGVKWTEPTTLFPTCIALGATWNPDLVHDVASVLSDEARAIYNGWHLDPAFKGEHKGLIYRAPVINISRNPYWGRIHEVYSEDPYLTGRMAVAYVRGLQGDDPRYLKIAATLKHYAINNVEHSRMKLDAVVPERIIHEYWLPHFREAVIEGHAQSLMASYNAINGTPNNINHWLLTDVLKTEWKHEGFVVSDLGGVKTMVEGHKAKTMTYEDAVAQSVMAGCDFSDKEYRENIAGAVRAGKITQERLDDAVSRVIRVRMRLGEFDPQEGQPWAALKPDIIGGKAHRELSLKAAQQSLVLLQNRDQLLPLDRRSIKRIAVIGPHADVITLNNYNGRPGKTVTVLQGVKDRGGQAVEVLHAIGGQIAPKPKPKDPKEVVAAFDIAAERAKAVETARACDVAVVCVGTNARIEQEGRDRTHLGLPGEQQALVEAVYAANPRTVVVLMSAGPLTVPWIKDHIPAVLQGWWGGDEGGHAVADVLFGDYNPAGRLPWTVYASEAQVPSQDEYDVTKGFTYLYLKGDPLYAFGHGLSYTTFAYGSLTLSSPTLAADGVLTASIDITNKGAKTGDEVVQLYVRHVSSSVPRPHQELRAFQRITLRAGETRSVSLSVPASKLAFYDVTTHAFRIESGTIEIRVGASSQDIRATQQVLVTGP